MLGLGGTFAVKILIPVIRLQIRYLPDYMSMIIALSIAGVILIDYIFSFITIFRLKKRLSKFREDNKLHDEISEEELSELEMDLEGDEGYTETARKAYKAAYGE